MPRITGRYERIRAGGEEVAAFIPEPLPPHDPAIALGGEVGSLLSRAEAALARLDLASAMVPPRSEPESFEPPLRVNTL